MAAPGSGAQPELSTRPETTIGRPLRLAATLRAVGSSARPGPRRSRGGPCVGPSHPRAGSPTVGVHRVELTVVALAGPLPAAAAVAGGSAAAGLRPAINRLPVTATAAPATTTTTATV